MILRWLIIALAAGLPTSLAAAEPLARAQVMTKAPIVAGQQVEIAVDILVPSFFKSAPDFPAFEIPDAIVTLPESRAQNLVETVDGEQYSGIRRTYAVIPEIAGDYALPPAKIAVAYADDSGATATSSVTLPPTGFSAGKTPGDWQDQSPFVATKVTVTQALDRDPASLKTGDTLVRTVTITADDTQAMMIPALRFDAPDGIKLYRKGPALADPGAQESDPNASLRSETITYLTVKPGMFEISAINLRWFNSSTGKMELASAPVIKLLVKPAPAVAQAIPTTSVADAIDMTATRRAIDRYLGKTALLGAAVICLYALAYLLAIRLQRAWMDRTRAYAQSQRRYFHDLEKALAGGDGRKTYRALDAWVRKLGFRSIERWARHSGDANLLHQVSAFERSLFGRPTTDTSLAPVGELSLAIAAARRQSHRPAKSNIGATTLLPTLNPQFSADPISMLPVRTSDFDAPGKFE